LQPSLGTSANVAPPTDNASGGAGMLEDARLLWHELLGHAHDSLHLAALETKLAGQSLVAMIAAAVVVAVLLVSAWLGLVGVVIFALVGAGVVASIALLIGVLANLLVALLLCAVIQRKSRHLRWAATIRSLRPLPKVQVDTERS
jgi:hypothetical protein